MAEQAPLEQNLSDSMQPLLQSVRWGAGCWEDALDEADVFAPSGKAGLHAQRYSTKRQRWRLQGRQAVCWGAEEEGLAAGL